MSRLSSARAACMYCNGEEVNQDLKEAAKCFQKAADHGHARAQHNLDIMYGKGQGVKQMFEEAVKPLQKAAKQGYVEAQFTRRTRTRDSDEIERGRRIS